MTDLFDPKQMFSTDNALFQPLEPLVKGGAGSGNHGHGGRAGVRGGSSGGGGGGGGGGGNAAIGKKIDAVNSHISDATDALENGNPSAAVDSLNSAYETVDEAVDDAGDKLTDNEKIKIEMIRDTAERNMDKAESELETNKSANNIKLTSAIENAIDQIGMITDVVSGAISR